MHFIAFYAICGLMPALIIQENVAFLKSDEIDISLSTFIIDLKLNENLFHKLSDDLRKAKITAYSIEQFHGFPSKQARWRGNNGLKDEIVPLLNDQITGAKLHRTACYTHKNEKVTDSYNR